MILPTKASDPASRLVLVVDRLTSRYLDPCVIFLKNRQALAIDFFFYTLFSYKEPVNFGRASLFSILWEISASIVLKVAPTVLHFPEPLNFTKGVLAHHDGLVPAVASWCYNSF